ncbi:MAG: Uma2 family endonuclease [Bryobacterales bacterium]|nr:Uma2 family endonuclease [Bryobacterales bacterium]
MVARRLHQYARVAGATIDPTPSLTSTNEPEPDAVVLRRPCTDFMAANAGPADILLVAEVAVSSLAYDMGAKAALYAAAGIEEYWVRDTTSRRVVVHRAPAEGRYQSVVEFAAHEAVSPLSAPAAQLRLASILG